MVNFYNSVPQSTQINAKAYQCHLLLISGSKKSQVPQKSELLRINSATPSANFEILSAIAVKGYLKSVCLPMTASGKKR